MKKRKEKRKYVARPGIEPRTQTYESGALPIALRDPAATNVAIAAKLMTRWAKYSMGQRLVVHLYGNTRSCDLEKCPDKLIKQSHEKLIPFLQPEILFAIGQKEKSCADARIKAHEAYCF